jgi:hypothetical protein
MKRGVSGKPPPRPEVASSDAQRIDAQYGLDPVIDVGAPGEPGGTPGGLQLHLVECPYCGERFETPVDTSSGSARYVEDCQVCCQPIEFNLEVDHEGVLQGLSTLRCD